MLTLSGNGRRKTMMKYKGYTAKIEYDSEALLFHGEVVGIDAVITFQARDAVTLKSEFETSVQDYLDWCQERGKEPNKPFSGNFPIRSTPEIHKKAVEAAEAQGMSLNEWLNLQLQNWVDQALHDTNFIKQ